MAQKKQIRISRATPRVKNKIFQLLIQQDADLTYNAQENLYEVDIKVSCKQREVLDQIAQSLSETIDERDRQNQYSFSRLLDPLEIYDNNIKATEPSAVDFTVLKSKIQTNIESAFLKLRQTLLSRYDRRTSPKKEPNPEEQLETSRQKFKQFLSSKMAEIKPQDVKKRQSPVTPKLFAKKESLKLQAHSSSTKLTEYFRLLSKTPKAI